MKYVKKYRTILVALASGVLLFLSFPANNLFPLAWVALVPLIYLLPYQTPPRAFLTGFLAGFISYLGILYWLFPMLHFNTGSLWQAAVAFIALCAYCALYMGLWAVIVRRTRSTSVIRFSLFAAAAWVSLEYVRTYALGGFPWALLGYSQWKFLPLIQLAQYSGVYGVSFLIIFFAAGLSQFLRTKRWANITGLIGAMIIIIMSGYILLIKNSFIPPPPYIKAAVIQGNIDQYKKWDAAFENEILDTYAKLAQKAAKYQPDIIIWPETAVPGFLPADAKLYGWLSNLARETNTYNLVGAPFNDGGTRFYNASFLFGPYGEILGWHRKTHLVPFGEYVPFRSLLSRWFGVLNRLGDFYAAKDPIVLSVKSVLWGTTICSENFFGSKTARLVRNGAQVLANQTNDAWFFKTAAADQHFVMNVFRAVENRRMVVVSGNTGVSGVIEPSGKITHRAAPFTTTYFVSQISPLRGLTFYTRWGDLAAWICIVITIIALFHALYYRRKFRHQLKEKL